MKNKSPDYDVLSSDWDTNLGDDSEFEALLIYLLKNRDDCINGNKQKCRPLRTSQKHKHYNHQPIYPSHVINDDDYMKKVSTRSLDSINGGYFVKRFAL